jgi:hypothetical protein
MGIFGKRSRNSVIPKASPRDYIPIFTGRTYDHSMFAPAWFERELKAGMKPNYLIDIAAESIHNNAGNAGTFLIAKFLGIGDLIASQLGLAANEDLTDAMEFSACLAGALSMIEMLDGARVQGKVHPSIWNGICFIPRQFGDIEKPGDRIGIAKAGEIGYLSVRSEIDFRPLVSRLEPLDSSFN